MKENYQLYTDKIINNLDGKVPTLLLHSCCGPCSTYVLKYLSSYFKITVLYYNPNIHPTNEYLKRKEEQLRFIKEFKSINKISFLDSDYNPELFFEISKGLEKEKEGGIRCSKCYLLRMEKTAKIAKEKSFNYFGTTLTVSPYKNAEKINHIGKYLEDKYKVKFLYSDFKKRNGYKESIALSKEYNLYRQDYCGCIYSKAKEEIL